MGGGGDTSSTSGGETTLSEGTGEGTAPAEGTTPAEARSVTFDLSPSADSDASGNTSLTETAQGVVVALNVENLNEPHGTVHLAQIYEGGTCADEQAGNSAQVLYPLNLVHVAPYPLNLESTDAQMSATDTTLIEGVTLDELLQGTPKYINVHAEENANGGPVPPSMLCADLRPASSDRNT